ncbi:hypothetical protein [Aureimonas sp. SA4125]|uniref:hypothetical protein n=1 Tax=Aureimonas sp. SA4125 TaxID=2826993 RepID=UPI001CC750E2|nr:hypothetical protein [Aureimonas sp. SA4125]
MSEAIRMGERPGLSADDAITALPRTTVSPSTPGMLVGRPDLGSKAMVEAIAERLRFEGRNPEHAPGVLKAALDGRRVAVAFMRRLVLPAPRVPLTMPIQAILREAPANDVQGSSSWLRFVSFGR